MKLQDTQGYTPITQKSIKNVKCTRIISGEGSDKYNKYIQYLSRKILKISASRQDNYINDEVGILARLDGTYESQPIYGYWNAEARTSVIYTYKNVEYNFMIDENESQSLIFVHNHPNNSSLSYNDIKSLININAIKCIVAVGNSGIIHYIIKVNQDNVLYQNISTKIRRLELIDINNINMIYNKIIDNPFNYGLYLE